MLGLILHEITKPPAGFAPPGTDIFDYTHSCIIGNGSYCVSKISFLLLLSAVIIGVLIFAAFRKPKLVPRGIQNTMESIIDFIRSGIVLEVMGEEGLAFLPFLTALFLFIWLNNMYGIIPFAQIPTTSTMSVAALLAITVWLLFNIVGVMKQGAGHYLKSVLFPPGVPLPIYILVTPIELVSVFIVRPLTLMVRLTANMIAGHLILTIFFLGTWYLQWKLMTIPVAAASLALGIFMTAFEVLVAFLQAYIFTILTAVYISGAMSSEH